MAIGEIDPMIFSYLTQEHLDKISEYIDDPMTATWFSEDKSKANRLMTLIRIASIESQPGKKMSKKDICSQNAALNRARRAKHRSKG